MDDACDAVYLYQCIKCGLSMNDLELMSYRQVRDLIEINAFYADAAAHRDEDRRSREAESRFWSSF